MRPEVRTLHEPVSHRIVVYAITMPFDIQFVTEHLSRFGAVEILRSGYRHLLAEALDGTATFYPELDPSEVERILQPMTQTS